MRNFSSKILVASVFIASVAEAQQNMSNGATAPSGSITNTLTSPQSFSPPANTYNFTRTWTPHIAVTDETSVYFTLQPPATTLGYATAASTTYYNGWGQAIENIVRGIPYSNTVIKDIVTPFDLRPSLTKNSYLPYTTTACSQFQANAFSDQASYYSALYSAEGTSACSQSVISYPNVIPTQSSYAPGKSLVGQQNGSTVSSTFNDPGNPDQNIVQYLYDDNASPNLVNSGYYGANQLHVKTTLMPHNGNVLEFYDKNGRLICKKVASQAGSSPDYISTYYVYDVYGRTRMIITPEGVNTSNTSDDYVNRYTYNGIGNITAKKVPGQTDWQSTVYDARKRAVLFQNALLRQDGKYWFTVYDSRDRVAMQGYITDANTPATWQGWLDGTIAMPQSSQGDLILILANGLSAPYPSSINSSEIDVINYYDTYPTASPFPSSAVFDNSFSSDYLGLGTSFTQPSPFFTQPVPYMFTQGLLTASKVKVMGTDPTIINPWISSEYFYDQKGHLIQTQTLNPWNNPGNNTWNNQNNPVLLFGNVDVTTSQYSFDGHKVLDIYKYYDRASSTKPDVKVVRQYNYDTEHRDRLTAVTQLIDNFSYRPLAAYTYDDFERVKMKTIGGVEDQHYDYNIRGQLTGINADYCNNGSSSSQAPNASYGSVLCYDYGFSDLRYDGKISGMLWRGSNSDLLRAYGYGYDIAGRISKADFNEKIQGPVFTSAWGNNAHDFSMSNVTYDKNGNMLSMNQRGNSNSAPVDIDLLNYNYLGNQLQYVSDAVSTNYGLGDFQDVAVHCGLTNTSPLCPDYTYDADGNLKSDANKAINTITYNYQDLPATVSFANGGSINNIYDARGTLVVKKIQYPTASTQAADVCRYWGPFNYRNDNLEFVLHDEGRARYHADSGLFKYDFFVKDHLGNVRTVVTADPYPATSYWAGYEVANANFEDAIFNNVSNIAHSKPGGNGNDQMAGRMNGSDSSRIGTSLMLHVMTGDKFDIAADSYWDQDSTTDTYADSVTMISSLFNTLLMNDAGEGTGGESNASQLVTSMYNSLSGNIAAYQGIINQATDPSVPRAYINYMFFDENMNFLAEQSGTMQISSTSGSWQNMQLPTLNAHQNGYLVTYMSNATWANVHMDHFNINVYQGKLLQEQNYYPFGLAVNEGQTPELPNKYLYQTNKLQDELGLNLSDFNARQYDQQIGRFHGVDPMDQFASGYVGMGNDPANKVDPMGTHANGYNPQSEAIAASLKPQTDGAVGGSGGGGGGFDIYVDGQKVGLSEAITILRSHGMDLQSAQGKGSTSSNENAASLGTSSTANTGTNTSVNAPTSENTVQNLNSGGDGSGSSEASCIPPMGLSIDGLVFIQEHEGFGKDGVNPYNDANGYATVGYGHLLHKSAFTRADVEQYGNMTETEGLALLNEDLQSKVSAVNNLVKVPLTQYQFNAIVSFTFNVGIGTHTTGLMGSDFLKQLNLGNYDGSLMMHFHTPSSIIGRRQDEINLFTTGQY